MKIKLSTNIYPYEAIINTCYNYLDRVYLYLDGNIDREITVYFKNKKDSLRLGLDKVKDEFLNDLVHSTLRLQVSRNNKKITEYIVNRALYSALPGQKDSTLDSLLGEEDTGLRQPKEDPLGIAIPWEEKYGPSEPAKTGNKLKKKKQR